MSCAAKGAMFVCVAVTLASAITLFCFLSWERSPISRSNFERIRIGMKEEDVEAILGGPPGYYGKPKYGTSHIGQDKHETWWGNDCAVFVGFDDHRRVVWKSFLDYEKWGNKGAISEDTPDAEQR